MGGGDQPVDSRVKDSGIIVLQDSHGPHHVGDRLQEGVGEDRFLHP